MTWYSQAGQDEWVHSIIGDTGYFVDVGAHDGVVHSNTYALEQLGWWGLCVEPNPEAFATLVANRRVDCWNVAASSTNGVVPFDGAHVGSGADVESKTLTDMLAEVDGWFGIDYLSIDVEGHELEVLAGMDFDRYSVRVATIEHNLYLRGPEHRDAIRERMIGLGFILAGADVVAPGYGAYEDWWIHGALL